MKRADDFQQRRAHLANLSDEELQARFWEMAEKIVDPLLDLGKKNTTPSIERSVLLRMGFSSLEAKAIVDKTMDRGLMGKGAVGSGAEILSSAMADRALDSFVRERRNACVMRME